MTNEEHVKSWHKFLETYADVDGNLPVYLHPGGFTWVYYLGDDRHLAEFCQPCAQKVASHPENFDPSAYQIRGSRAYPPGEIIHCLGCDREMIAPYKVTEERKQ